MKIEFNRTNEKLVILATSKADRSKLQAMAADMRNVGMVFTITDTQLTGVTVRIPMTSSSFMESIARFTATHS